MNRRRFGDPRELRRLGPHIGYQYVAAGRCWICAWLLVFVVFIKGVREGESAHRMGATSGKMSGRGHRLEGGLEPFVGFRCHEVREVGVERRKRKR